MNFRGLRDIEGLGASKKRVGLAAVIDKDGTEVSGKEEQYWPSSLADGALRLTGTYGTASPYLAQKASRDGRGAPSLYMLYSFAQKS